MFFPPDLLRVLGVPFLAHFKIGLYLPCTNASPQEFIRKGFTLPQAAHFHLSEGIDKTRQSLSTGQKRMESCMYGED